MYIVHITIVRTMSPDEMCNLLNNEVDDDGCVVKGFVDEEDIHSTSYRCPTIICYHLQDIMLVIL